MTVFDMKEMMILPRPKKKEYDSKIVLGDLIDIAADLYDSTGQIKIVAAELNLAEHKVKKLMITGKVLSYPQTDQIQELIKAGHTMVEVESIMSLSKASINAYLPYSKVPYKESEVSANADRCEKYRQRKAAVAAIHDMETLWKAIELFAGYVFHTATGLKYTYTVHGGELFISRKEKSVTMSTVEKAYKKVAGDSVRIYNRPKDQGDLFGISYIYPIFYRFGLIDVPEKVKRKMVYNKKIL